MLSDFMQDQQRKLIQEIQERPGCVDAKAVAALVLLDILDILQELRHPFNSEK